jgi:hypothetical protein
LLSGPYARDVMNPVRFALPFSEAQEIIEAWLKQKGYDVKKEESRDAVFMKASGKNGYFKVNIAADSPVACLIDIEALQDGNPDPADLSKYLNAYVNRSKAEKDPGNNDTRVVADAGSAISGNSDSVVCIEAILHGETVNLTGFVADKKGLILCTAHYLDSSSAINVVTKIGKVLSGRMIKIDRKKDIAFIDCNYNFKTEVDVLKGQSGLKDSQKIMALGCTQNNSRQMLKGVVSGSSRKVDGQVYWQAKMKVRPGDSGGPVFTERGVFAGIIKGGLRGRLDYTYIIPLDTVLLFIRER